MRNKVQIVKLIKEVNVLPIDKDKLTAAMIKNKMNMSKLAEESEVSKSQISRLMNENTKTIRLDTLGKIAGALGVDYKDLLKEEKTTAN